MMNVSQHIRLASGHHAGERGLVRPLFTGEFDDGLRCLGLMSEAELRIWNAARAERLLDVERRRHAVDVGVERLAPRRRGPTCVRLATKAVAA